MPFNRPRWNLKHLAILIAVLALGFAIFGVSATVLLGLISSPFWLLPRGRRREGFYWILTCCPIFLLLGVYLTWFTAWALLGHVPRVNRDDPKNIALLEGPYILAFLLLIVSPLVSIVGAFVTILQVCDPRRASWHWFDRSYPLFLFPSLCLVGYGILRWDPWNAFHWFMD